MYCPVCKDERLVISERSGIEIDYCPKCRGVWLDRGELDKIIERAEGAAAQQQRPQQQNQNDLYGRKETHMAAKTKKVAKTVKKATSKKK